MTETRKPHQNRCAGWTARDGIALKVVGLGLKFGDVLPLDGLLSHSFDVGLTWGNGR